MPHTAAVDLMAPLASLHRIQNQWGDFNMAVFSPFLFSFFLTQLCPWGDWTRSPACITDRNKWHKTDLHGEMHCDEGLAHTIWTGPFVTLSRQNHEYLKDRVSSLALSCLGLSKLHAITLIDYFSPLIPVCLHKADDKICAEGAARWDKIEDLTFFKLSQLLCAIWQDNIHFPLMANETEVSETPRTGGCAPPQPHCFAVAWDGQSTTNEAIYICQWGSRTDMPIGIYTHFHCPVTAQDNNCLPWPYT